MNQPPNVSMNPDAGQRPAERAGTLGPFDTERQVRELAAVRAIFDAALATGGGGGLSTGNRQLLGRVLAGARVRLGAYDERIVSWLAGWEPQVVAVIAGWITRAEPGPHRSETLDAALADAIAYRRDRAGQPCRACDQAADGLCDIHAIDLDVAGIYQRLARTLRNRP